MACSLLAQDSDDAPVSMAVAVRDTSHRQAADAGLREAMSLLSATLESTADGILVVSGDGRIAGVNNQFISMWGIPRELLATQDDEAVMGFVLDQLVDPGQFVEKVTALYADPSAESHDVLDFRDGRTFERYSRPQKVADKVVGRVWSFRDVTPARIAQDRITQAMADLAEQAAQLKDLAFQDPLTGLSNRQLFNDHLAAALRGPCGTAVDVLLLDLDDFKEVNDILGHHAGDQMLIEVGRRLRECVRPNDVVARLGGDEFVVLLVGSLDAEAVAERIVDSLRVPAVDRRDHAAAQPEPGAGVHQRGRRGRLRAAAPRRRRHVRGEIRREEPVPAVPAGNDEGPRAAHRAGGRAAAGRRRRPDRRALPADRLDPAAASWSRSRRWPAGSATAKPSRRSSSSRRRSAAA